MQTLGSSRIHRLRFLQGYEGHCIQSGGDDKPWFPRTLYRTAVGMLCDRPADRGRDGAVRATPPSEPDGRISRIRLSS